MNLSLYIFKLLMTIRWKSDIMRNKKRINTTFDNELWDLLLLQYGSRRVEILEELARARLFGEKSIEDLEMEIEHDKAELKAKEKMLEEMKRVRDMNDNNKALIQKAMTTIRRIIENQGNVIGLNQINNVSRINGLSCGILQKETKKIKDIQIPPIYDPPKN